MDDAQDAPKVDVDEAIDSMPKVLRAPFRKFIKQMMAKAGKPADEKESDEADKEREALADLHESHSGKAPKIEVLDDDLPFDLSNEAEGDEASEDASEPDAEKPATKKKGK